VTNTIATVNPACHYRYRARAKCYGTAGFWHHKYGTWRDGNYPSSEAGCGRNYKLAKAWFGLFKTRTRWYKVYR
jgi:hypothetical protein